MDLLSLFIFRQKSLLGERSEPIKIETIFINIFLKLYKKNRRALICNGL